jgi:hypothetical protein
VEIGDENAYRDAIAELHRLGQPKPGSEAERRRQSLIAAIEAYAQESGPEARKGKPFRSIATRGA